MLRFQSETSVDFVEIAIAQWNQNSFSERDGHLTIVVNSAGFVGHNDLWISANCLEKFCKDLVDLERGRQGEANLESISPNELRLKIRSVDRKGHMAIEGSTGYYVQRPNSLMWHAIHFGFEFDPSQLAVAIKEDWIQHIQD